MSISRRQFIQRSAVALGLGMMPFRVRAKEAETALLNPETTIAHLVSPAAASLADQPKAERCQRSFYQVSREVMCFLYVLDPHSPVPLCRMGMSGVGLCMSASCAEPGGLAERGSTEVRIENLYGVMSQADGVFLLANIEHRYDAILGFLTLNQPDLGLASTESLAVYPSRELDWQLKRTGWFGLRLKRPVILSAGTDWLSQSISPMTRIDAYGINGGKDIEVPASARVAKISNLRMVSSDLPTWLPHQELNDYMQACPMVRSDFDYDHLTSDYHARRSQQTPAERQAEEEAVQNYANDNRDTTAWDRAADQLKTFDPSHYGRRRWRTLL